MLEFGGEDVGDDQVISSHGFHLDRKLTVDSGQSVKGQTQFFEVEFLLGEFCPKFCLCSGEGGVDGGVVAKESIFRGNGFLELV